MIPSWIIRIASLTLTFALWEWYGRDVDPIFMSYPSAIVLAVPKMIAAGELQTAFLTSLLQFAIGFALAVALGVFLGVVTGRYRIVENAIDMQISALYATPMVALIPLFILWFGLGATVKVIIIFLAAFFPIIVNTQGGVKNVSGGWVEVVEAEGANEWQIMTKVVIPASLPFIMAGLRLGVGRAVVGMVVAEMFTAISGLGGAIVTYSNSFQTDRLFVIVILLALMGVGFAEGIKVLETRLARWKTTERAQ